MNKLAVVLGVAAVATLAGCKDPEYARITPAPQDEAKNIETEPAKEAPAKTEEIKSAEVVETAPKCTCPSGTKHVKPCECGAADCQCIVEAKAVEPEYTTYIVQRGDYLAKISKKYNVTISSIKRLNNLKSDNVRLGQKLKLPGKIDIGAQTVPEGAVKKAPAKKAYASYKGATKEYVVKSGDSLGKIAYSNGMNIRQLKELNGLKGDNLKIGQKLKIAAGAKAEAKPVEKKAEKKEATVTIVVDDKKPVEPQEPAVNDAAATAEPAVDSAAAPAPVDGAKATEGAAAPVPAEAAPAAGTTTYVVQEGDSLPRIAIDFEVPVARIRELNKLGEGDEVKVGQALVIPAAQ